MSKKIKNVKEWPGENDKQLYLTPEEVRAFPNFTNATDEEVENIIKTVYAFAWIAYKAFCNEENNGNPDNQLVKI